MRITTVAGSEQISRGNKLEAIRGRITKIYDRKTGTNEHGEWAMQTLVFQDDTGTIDLMLKDREPIDPGWKGCMVLISAGEYKGHPCGIEMDEYKEKRRFKVTASATIEQGSRPSSQQEQQRPSNHQPRQSLQDEERQEQQRSRPNSQQEQQRPPQRQQEQAPPRQQQSQPPAQRQQERPPQQDPASYIADTKRSVMSLAHLYTICHDAAVLHATSVYTRHGFAPHPASIGALATTLFIESNRKQIGANLPPTDLTRLTAPQNRMEDIVLAYEQHMRQDTESPQQSPQQSPQPQQESLADMPDQQW